MNKMNRFAKTLVIGMLAASTLPLGNVSAQEVTEITFPSFKTGQNVGAELFLGQVERFNQAYEGQYKINVEEIPQDAYGEQMKQLALQNDLPVIVHAAGSGSVDIQWFEDVIIENEMYYDLSGWLNERPELTEIMIEEIAEFNTQEEGSVVSLPDYRVRPPFLYYNESMYNPETPVREMSLDEFKESLGENKIAFMTGENVWTTGIFWTAIIANEEGGAELLSSYSNGELEDVTDPIFISSIEKLQAYIADNGTENTLGAIYADAANAFMSKNAALIANGPWMTVDFEEASSDKWSNDFSGTDIRGDYFPGNVGISSYEVYGDWISASASEEEVELALTWFEFVLSPEEIETNILSEGGQTPNYEPSEEFITALQEQTILYDIQEATTDEITYVPNILDLLPASVSGNDLARFLPQLVTGELSAEEFAQAITSAAQAAQ